MITIRFNTKQFIKKLENTVEYGTGFAVTAKNLESQFSRQIAEIVTNLLEKYIDSKAQISPESLHHVYEWGSVGSPSGRLFTFTTTPYKNVIRINGKFLESRSSPPNGGDPFSQKANIMENQIQMTIRPKNGPRLVFEDNNELVFAKEVHIVHPGGAAAGGAFEATVNEFFDSYVTNVLMRSVLANKKYAKEFRQYFTGSGGYKAGQRAARKYMSLKENIE